MDAKEDLQSLRCPAARNDDHRRGGDAIAGDDEERGGGTRDRAEGHADEGDEGTGRGPVAGELRQRVGEKQNDHHGDEDGNWRPHSGAGNDEAETEEETHGRGDVGQGRGNDLLQAEAVALEALSAPYDGAHAVSLFVIRFPANVAAREGSAFYDDPSSIKA